MLQGTYFRLFFFNSTGLPNFEVVEKWYLDCKA